MLDRATGLGIRPSSASGRTGGGPTGSGPTGSSPTGSSPTGSVLRVVGGTQTTLPPDPHRLGIPTEPAVIQPQESTFAALLFGLIPSPRAARRFAGVYRQIKAGVAAAELPQFEGTDGLGGHYQVPMLLLAIRIGTPAAAERLFPILRDAAARGDDLRALLRSCTSVAPGLASMTIVEQIARPIMADMSFPALPRLFSVWVPRIARYRFDMTGAPRCTWLSVPDRTNSGLPKLGLTSPALLRSAPGGWTAHL